MRHIISSGLSIRRLWPYCPGPGATEGLSSQTPITSPKYPRAKDFAYHPAFKRHTDQWAAYFQLRLGGEGGRKDVFQLGLFGW